MPETQKQLRAAHAVAEGESHVMPKKVADEMIRAFHGHKMSELPESASTKHKVYHRLYGRSD